MEYLEITDQVRMILVTTPKMRQAVALTNMITDLLKEGREQVAELVQENINLRQAANEMFLLADGRAKQIDGLKATIEHGLHEMAKLDHTIAELESEIERMDEYMKYVDKEAP